jgi:RNA polymerase sigma-70 factor (ECF subfamily)
MSSPTGSSPSTSLTLLERARRNDAAAWQQMLEVYGPLVYSWCRREGLQAADTDDLFLNVMGAVARGLGRFRKERPGDTFRGWLRVITRNEIADYWRRVSREPPAAGGTDHAQTLTEVPSPAEDEEERGLLRHVWGVIQREFSGPACEAFWRTAVDGRDPADVAGDLGMSVAAVYKARSRVRAWLKENWDDVLE